MKEDEKRRDGREEMILTVGREIPSEEQKDNKLFHTGCHAVLPSTHTLQKAEQVCGRPIKGQPASQPPSHPGLRETSGHTADSRCGCVRTQRTAAVKGDAVTHSGGAGGRGKGHEGHCSLISTTLTPHHTRHQRFFLNTRSLQASAHGHFSLAPLFIFY